MYESRFSMLDDRKYLLILFPLGKHLQHIPVEYICKNEQAITKSVSHSVT